MKARIQYKFTGKVWKHDAPGGWYFVSLPKKLSMEIRQSLQWQEEGWGRMKAEAQINEVQWETAIWYDSKRETYLLPIKADIRRMTGLLEEQNVEVSLWV